MLDKGKISTWQLIAMLPLTILSTGLFLMTHLIFKNAGRDSWLVGLTFLASLSLLSLIWVKLGLRFPNQTLAQYSQTLLGRPVGIIINILYIWFFMFLVGIVTGEFVDIISIFLPDIPFMALSGSMIALIVYTVRHGLEVIARTAVIVLVLLYIITITLLIVLIPQVNFQEMLPIMAEGIGPLIRANFYPLTWAGEMVFVLMIIPQLKKPSELPKGILVSLLLISMIGILFETISVGILGPSKNRFYFPYLELVRMVSVRADLLVVIAWVSGIFTKITYFLYVANLALAQSFKLSTLNKTILPLGFLGGTLSAFLFTTTTETYNFIDKIFPAYAITMEFIIPAILLTIAALRRLP